MVAPPLTDEDEDIGYSGVLESIDGEGAVDYQERRQDQELVVSGRDRVQHKDMKLSEQYFGVFSPQTPNLDGGQAVRPESQSAQRKREKETSKIRQPLDRRPYR